MIAATGYRPVLESLVGHLDVLDDRGFPQVIDGEAQPGLRFHGYDTLPRADSAVRHKEARRTAKDVARRLVRPPAASVAVPVTTTRWTRNGLPDEFQRFTIGGPSAPEPQFTLP